MSRPACLEGAYKRLLFNPALWALSGYVPLLGNWLAQARMEFIFPGAREAMRPLRRKNLDAPGRGA